MLNFGSLATTPVASSVKYLKPYTICKDVEIESTEIKEGTSSKGNDWKMLKINFTSPEGKYSESIFYPKDGDEVRKEVDMPNGGKRYMCSNLEVTMAMVAAIGRAFNPEGFKKLQELSSKFKTFDDVVAGFTKILEKAKGVKTSMKLIGRTSADGRVYAKLPQPLGITQDNGEWRTFAVNIFGDNLTFSSYEMQQKNKLENSKPTKMEASEATVDTATDIDTDSLLDDLAAL